MKRLEGRVALVTGGAAGIGRAVVERFIEEGAQVAFCDVNAARGQQLVSEVGGHFSVVDVAKRDAVRNWVDTVAKKFGALDILVNNAGILRDGQLVRVKDNEIIGEMPESDFNAVIDINLKGVYHAGQAAAAHMILQRRGVILNASSVVGLDGNFGQTNYVAAKAAVIGMTKTWARELGRFGIRVNAVAPGFTATEIIKDMPQRVLDMMRSRTPLGRMGEVRDIANAYLFLASDEASFISGAVLRVDGGLVVGT